jgi:hypothetical protein
MSKFIDQCETNLRLFERLNGRLPSNADEFAEFCEYVSKNSISNKSIGNIEACFMEDMIREIEEDYYNSLTEADFWDGDETDKIQY